MNRSQARLRTNLVANFAGRWWAALIRIAFIPIYLHYLGVEGFGLIGVYSTLTALLVVLDLGLSATLTREMARLGGQSEHAQEARDVARTFAVIYWFIGVLAATLLAVAAPLLATQWLKPQHLSFGTVRFALWAMAASFGLQWPISLYTSGLLGLQRHAGLNALTAAVITLQGAGTVMVLKFISPTVAAYFLFQICGTGALVAGLSVYFWRTLNPDGEPRRVRWSILRDRWEFAGGMLAITLTSTVLTQSDKVILSRLLPLTDFGYYAFAFAVASALSYIAAPVYTAVYPRLVQITASDDERAEAVLYHTAAQLMSVLLIPAAVLLVAFPRELLTLYSRDMALSLRTAPVLSLLAAGVGLNALMLMPLALQLANGWTSLSVWKNVVACALYVPIGILMIYRFGPLGAASTFIALNVGYVLVEVPLMHRRVLRREMFSWYWRDVGRPLLATIAIAIVARQFSPSVPPTFVLPFLCGAAGVMVSAAALAAPTPRRIALSYFRRRM